MDDKGLTIAGATITMTPVLRATSASFWGTIITSDAHGTFFIPDVEEGSYNFKVQANGFAPSSRIIDVGAAPMVEIKMEPLVTMRLRFLQTDGKPLANGTAFLYGSSIVRLQTNANGVASLPNMVPQFYFVHVVAPGHGYVTEGITLPPSVNSEPIELRLHEGGVLRVTTLRAIRGDDTQATERPLGRLSMTDTTFTPQNAAERGMGTVPVGPLYEQMGLMTRDGDGTVEINDVAPGTYSISPKFAKDTFGSQPRPPVPAQTIEIKGRETGTLTFKIDLEVHFSTIQVTVRNAQGQPVAGQDFSLQLDLLNDTGSIIRTTRRLARSDANGKFPIYPVLPGNWRVTLFPRLAGEFSNATIGTAPQTVKLATEDAALTFTLPAK